MTHKRSPGDAMLLSVAAVHCWDLSGVSRSVERDFLSVLLIYPRIFLNVLFVSSLIRISYYVYIFSLCLCVLAVLV